RSAPPRSPPFPYTTLFRSTLAADEAYAPEPGRDAAQSCVPEETFAAAPRDPAEAILVKYLSRRFLIAAEATERMVGAPRQILHRSEEHTSELQSRENLVCR